jgi:hypothetical protein
MEKLRSKLIKNMMETLFVIFGRLTETCTTKVAEGLHNHDSCQGNIETSLNEIMWRI